jgi:hypothetical protein
METQEKERRRWPAAIWREERERIKLIASYKNI